MWGIIFLKCQVISNSAKLSSAPSAYTSHGLRQFNCFLWAPVSHTYKAGLGIPALTVSQDDIYVYIYTYDLALSEFYRSAFQ